MTSAYVQQRSVEYDLLTPTNVAASGTTILTWDSGPHLNYTPPGEVVYTYQNGTGYASKTPWPNPIATPTDHITLPDNGPYLCEAGVYCRITNPGSITGTIYFDLYDRTADAVLDGTSLTGINFVGGTATYTVTIMPGPDANVLNGVAGHQLCIRVRNQSNVTVQMSPGGIYTDWFAVRELSHSVDPATTLPVTTTPASIPVQVFALVDQATVSVLSGSVVVTHNGTPTTYTSGDHTAFVGDALVTGTNSVIVVTMFDGSTRDVEPSTTTVITALAQTPGGGQSFSFLDEAGRTWSRVMRLIDAQSRFETTTASGTAFDRGSYQVTRDGSGNSTISVLDGVAQVN